MYQKLNKGKSGSRK